MLSGATGCDLNIYNYTYNAVTETSKKEVILHARENYSKEKNELNL